MDIFVKTISVLKSQILVILHLVDQELTVWLTIRVMQFAGKKSINLQLMLMYAFCFEAIIALLVQYTENPLYKQMN